MSTLKVTNIAGLSGSSTDVMSGLAKAYVFFNQAGTQSVYGSFNISSITDAGTGRTYPISYTNNMNDATYTASWYQNASTNTDYTYFSNNYTGSVGSKATSSCGVRSYSTQDIDATACDLIIQGDLA